MLTQEKALHIDIPVKMDDVNIVFSVASLSFEGDRQIDSRMEGAELHDPRNSAVWT